MGRGTRLRCIYLLFMVAGSLAGCSDWLAERGDDDSIQILCTIPGPDTKTSMSADQASFTTNDKVGIYEALTGKMNVLYNYGSPVWTTAAPLYWKDYQSQHQFYAYYPYNASSSGFSVTIPLLSGQTVSGIPDAKSDMVVASLSQKRISAVNLGFSHTFALLKFNINFASTLLATLLPGRIIVTGGNLAASSVGPYGLFNSVNALNKISYNLSSAAFSYSPNDVTVFQQSLAASLPSLISGATTVYILVLPGVYNNPQPSVQFTMKIILSGLEMYSLPQSLSITTLKANTRYEYNVTVIKNLITKGEDSHPFEVVISPI